MEVKILGKLWRSETSLFTLRVLHLKNIFRKFINSIKQGFGFIAFLYQIRKYINLYRCMTQRMVPGSDIKYVNVFKVN